MTEQPTAPQTSGHTIHWARWYDLVSWLLSFGRGEAIRRTIVQESGVQARESVLDVGCGTGTLALALGAKAGADGHVTGIDASTEMITVARAKAKRQGAEVTFQVEAIESLSFAAQSFDLATSTMMLHHLPDDVKQDGLAELARVLKPGGRLLAVDFDSESGTILGHLFSVLGHKRGDSSYPAVETMLREAGFTAIEKVNTKYKQLMVVRARKR